jgi:hypothetical protein
MYISQILRLLGVDSDRHAVDADELEGEHLPAVDGVRVATLRNIKKVSHRSNER